MSDGGGWHLDGSLWKVPFRRNRHHHPFLPADMDSQNDSRSKASVIKHDIMAITEARLRQTYLVFFIQEIPSHLTKTSCFCVKEIV